MGSRPSSGKHLGCMALLRTAFPLQEGCVVPGKVARAWTPALTTRLLLSLSRAEAWEACCFFLRSSEQVAGLQDAPGPTGRSVLGENLRVLFLLVITGTKFGVRRRGVALAPGALF